MARITTIWSPRQNRAQTTTNLYTLVTGVLSLTGVMLIRYRSLAVLALSGASTVLACQSSRTPAKDSAWTTDSIAYEVALAKWRADSTVRDSVSRLVNTDSLYALYRSMVLAKDPHAVAQERSCARYRLVHRFGVIPVDLAVSRMEDTVWQGIALKDMRRLMEVKSRIVEVRLSREICGIKDREGPWIINGVDLNSFTDRPSLPRR